MSATEVCQCSYPGTSSSLTALQSLSAHPPNHKITLTEILQIEHYLTIAESSPCRSHGLQISCFLGRRYPVLLFPSLGTNRYCMIAPILGQGSVSPMYPLQCWTASRTSTPGIRPQYLHNRLSLSQPTKTNTLPIHQAIMEPIYHGLHLQSKYESGLLHAPSLLPPLLPVQPQLWPRERHPS